LFELRSSFAASVPLFALSGDPFPGVDALFIDVTNWSASVLLALLVLLLLAVLVAA
jgi:hypothetical protein